MLLKDRHKFGVLDWITGGETGFVAGRTRDGKRVAVELWYPSAFNFVGSLADEDIYMESAGDIAEKQEENGADKKPATPRKAEEKKPEPAKEAPKPAPAAPVSDDLADAAKAAEEAAKAAEQVAAADESKENAESENAAASENK